MAAPLQPGPARRDKARKAYQMALRRVTFTEIGQALDVSRQLVSTLVNEEQERQWEDRDTAELEAEKRRAIHTYEEVIRGAWQRLGHIKDNSLNVSGLYNVIISAQVKIDEITGVRKIAEGSGVNVNVNVDNRSTQADYSHLSEEELRAHRDILAKLRNPGSGRRGILPSRN